MCSNFKKTLFINLTQFNIFLKKERIKVSYNATLSILCVYLMQHESTKIIIKRTKYAHEYVCVSHKRMSTKKKLGHH